MTDITAVCFDAFGTLIRYGGPRTHPYRHLLRSTQQDTSATRLPLLTRNVSITTLATELGLSHLLPAIQHELEEEIAGLELYPEVEAVLTQLRATGKRLAVCSNLATEYGPVVRQLLPSLDAYILSFEVGAAKPDPAIYTAVCAALGSHPGNILFIGDSKRCDLHGPATFGMQSRWLDRHSGQTLADILREHGQERPMPERLTVARVPFDREQFEDVHTLPLRAEMEQDGQWARAQLQARDRGELSLPLELPIWVTKGEPQ